VSAATVRRVAVRVDGVVQGVGFRPYVFRLAEQHRLAGFVRNDTRGVLVEVEGSPGEVERFLAELPLRAPPLARVEHLSARELPPAGARAFEIRQSDGDGAPAALVSADTATCAACLAELFDPRDRRFRYPFVNCTNCGPRFTIVRDLPYDRPLTTMASFAMCEACRAEYDDPRDRRFHAQPNACPVCGPRVRLVGASERDAPDAVAAAARLLRAGAIIAVKGIGGYHLACRADDERAVATLRARKRREDKPFALMARDLAAAGAFVELRGPDLAQLVSTARPIVCAPRRADALVAAAVAPRSRELGVMLPYSPLHHLLLADAGCTLVLTSGNVSDEPIAYRDEDALARLAPIADAFLLHDRPIHTRTDDSVVRAAGRRPVLLRRSRGLVPGCLPLPVPARRPLLACGAELKSTFCVAKERRAWVSHHVGDLDDAETLASFVEGIAHFERLFAVAPELVVHDLHPDYHSTAYALARAGVETLAVQHHHAHLAACLAEHGETGTAVGAIYDGSGLGCDGTIWGGELLVGNLFGFERVGSLVGVRLPGGDRAVREPWRMACAWLVAACGTDPPLPRSLAGQVEPARWRAVAQMAERGFAAPPTTSMGRLFDAVAALCGLRARVSYEGQAAAELEAVADRGEQGAYELPVIAGRGERALPRAPSCERGAQIAGPPRAPSREGGAQIAGLPCAPSRERGAQIAGPPCAPSRERGAQIAGPPSPERDVHATPPGHAASLKLDARPLIPAVLADLARGATPALVAARFHRAVAIATARACAAAAERAGTERVVLAGGVFQNRLLLDATAARLEAAGLRVLVPERLPPNDGAISYGQAAIAAAREAA
jgi:hydrogenase maturation protein HypF